MRNLSGTDSSAASGTVVGIVEFLELDLPTGNLYLTNGNKAYTWGGNTYSPVTSSGTQYGSITNYNEAADSVPRPMNLILSGVDQTLINNLVGNNIQWVNIKYSIGFIDSNNNLLDNPSFTAPMFLGDCTISLTQNGGQITINAESLLADLQNRLSGCLQTGADQLNRFSGDTFFNDIGSLINKEIYWGQYGPNQVGQLLGGGQSQQDGYGTRWQRQ